MRNEFRNITIRNCGIGISLPENLEGFYFEGIDITGCKTAVEVRDAIADLEPKVAAAIEARPEEDRSRLRKLWEEAKTQFMIGSNALMVQYLSHTLGIG